MNARALRLATLLTVGLLLATGVCAQGDVSPADPADIVVPPGYEVSVFADNLSYPGDATFGPDGSLYVTEVGGHTYGTKPEEAPPAQILRIRPDGTREVIYDVVVPLDVIRAAEFGAPIPAEGLIPPITGVTYNADNGLLYISHRNRYSTLNPETGAFDTLFDGLPVWGEFLNAKPVFGPDGKMYFVISSQGNSGNVDGHMIKVMEIFNKPDAREVPCEDVAVTGHDFWIDNTLTPAQGDSVRAEVYVELGRNTEYGEVIPGEFWCNGALYRADPDGSNPERLAWGLRSLYGYNFSPTGYLLATQNSGNIMAPRPIYDDFETLLLLEEGNWYGWPDYYSGLPITLDRFARPNEPDWKGTPFPHAFSLTPETRAELMRNEPIPPQPLVRLPIHSATEGFVFGRPAFGIPESEILVAEFGAIIDYYADPESWPGFRVQRVNPWTNEVSDFMVNRERKPAWATEGGGLRRPIMPVWGPDGALYVVDFGVIHFTGKGMNAVPNTGVIWKVTRTGGIGAAVPRQNAPTGGLPTRITPPVEVSARAGGEVKWIFPGPRELSQAVFGTPDRPLGWQEHVGVPLDKRVVENGAYVRTERPTSHSDEWARIDGTTAFTVRDVTALDGPESEDEVDFEAEFTGPEHSEFRVVVNEVIPKGPHHSFFGGVATNTFLHGSTGLGTMLQPQQFAYAAFWGVGDLYRDGEKVADQQVVHVMMTQRVRTADEAGYELVQTPQVDELKGMGRQVHVILPPMRVTPSGPKHRPVPTGVQLPNGQMQPFIHVMYDQVLEVSAGALPLSADS